jgi:hypothetical protein
MPLNDIQRRIKRSKQSERDGGHWLEKHDGIDPAWKHVASSALRVGHITGLQFDMVSLHYTAENKQIKLPAKFLQFWMQIVDISTTHGKDALLRIEPTNVLVGPRKKAPIMHIITEERHAELLRKEREYDEVAEDAWKYRDLSE